MNHKQYREWLPLFIYNDLEDNQKNELKEHLKECSACATELSQIEKLHMLVSDRPLLQPSQKLLQESRNDLRVALRMERSRKTWMEKLFEDARGYMPYFKLAAGAMAMLVFGVLIGHYAFPPAVPPLAVTEVKKPTAIEQSDVQLTNIKFQDSDPSDGEIEFTVDAVKPMHVKGGVNDPMVQKVLTYAMVNNQNPGIRLRAASALGTEQTKMPDPLVKVALINVLKNDENDGVRKQALEALQKFTSDEEVKDAFLHVLAHDKVPGMRVAAIKSLDTGHFRDQDVLNVLREKSKSDENDFIRLKARTVLQEVSQKQ